MPKGLYLKKRPEDNVEGIPFWVPTRIAYEKHIERIKKMVLKRAKLDNQAKDPGYWEQMDRELRDTKPDVFVDRSAKGRPVFVVGMGKLFREDMKDLAKRTLEKPSPMKEAAENNTLKEDVAKVLDQRYRDSRGIKTFHIRNNPAVRKENG